MHAGGVNSTIFFVEPSLSLSMHSVRYVLPDFQHNVQNDIQTELEFDLFDVHWTILLNKHVDKKTDNLIQVNVAFKSKACHFYSAMKLHCRFGLYIDGNSDSFLRTYGNDNLSLSDEINIPLCEKKVITNIRCKSKDAIHFIFTFKEKVILISEIGSEISHSSVLTKLHRDKTTADVCFQIGDDIIYAHRAILSCESPYFHAMFYTSDMQESRIDKNTPIAFPDVEASTFNHMLNYCYFGRRKLEGLDIEEYWRLLAMADGSQMRTLKAIALFELYSLRNAENVLDMLMTITQYKDELCCAMRKKLIDYMFTLDDKDTIALVFTEFLDRHVLYT